MKKQSSVYWCFEKGIEIIGLIQPALDRITIRIFDPDGWDRKNLEQSLRELITEKEFNRRLMHSTQERIKREEQGEIVKKTLDRIKKIDEAHKNAANSKLRFGEEQGE